MVASCFVTAPLNEQLYRPETTRTPLQPTQKDTKHYETNAKTQLQHKQHTLEALTYSITR